MSFYTDVIQQDPRYTSVGRICAADLLEPVTRAAVEAIMIASANNGIPLIAFETYRSQARQAQLYAAGATQLRTVGVHAYGLACDLVKDVGGQPSWDGDFSFLRPLALAHGLVWGGDWGDSTVHHSFVDMVHVQRINVADQPKLFSGAWYPDADYAPTCK